MNNATDCKISEVSISAAKKTDGSICVSLTNVNLDKAKTVELALDGASSQSVTGEILTAKNMDDYNDFNHPEVVRRTAFKDSKIKRRKIRLKVPAMSVVVFNVS